MQMFCTLSFVFVFRPMYSGSQSLHLLLGMYRFWTIQPGSHRRKSTYGTFSFFLRCLP